VSRGLRRPFERRSHRRKRAAVLRHEPVKGRNRDGVSQYDRDLPPRRPALGLTLGIGGGGRYRGALRAAMAASRLPVVGRRILA
jgi:hypothetical protein